MESDNESDTKYLKSEDGQKVEITFAQSARNMLLTSYLNILLIASPIAIICYATGADDIVTFIFSLIALAPLAERLGYVTEQLAMHTNETIGGLLNATFGNATELIVSITALARGLYKLVQLSLLGSILSNLLLVLGTAFFFGGMYNKSQKYKKISSQINSTLLMLATMSILFPTILYQSGKVSKLSEIGLSRGTSLVLLFIYGGYLYFQLHSHKHLYDDDDKEETSVRGSQATKQDDTEKNLVQKPAEEEEKEEDELGFYNALFWLAAITVLIAILSDAISASIQNAADSANISGVFIAAILLPIVGNAAEHAGAVMFAMKGKVDLALGVAIGSSTQIALCVLPALVILGWMMGSDLDMNFGPFEASTVFLTVVSVTFAIKDGESNWLLGLCLVGAYVIISIAFWAHTNDDLSS